MIYKGFTDKQMELIQPGSLEGYLKETGWRKIAHHAEGNFTVYRQPGFEVLVLHDGTGSPGYVRRMAEAVHEIADYENRPPDDIFQQLMAETTAACVAS